MGIIDDKKGIFNEIGAFVSIKEYVEIPDGNDSLSSINNTKEIVPFLLDMLTVLAGSEVLMSTVGELMTGYIRNIEPKLKDGLKKQFSTFNSDQTLPIGFASGYSFKMKDIDSFGKLKTDPSSQVGSLLYNSNPVDFDNVLYNSIVNVGTDVDFGGIITMKYDDVLDNVTIKPVNASVNIGNFINDYIDNITLIDESQVISKISDAIFGVITTNQNKTETEAISEEILNKTIQKIINEDESVDITIDELRSIQESAKEKINGITTVDLGCGVLDNVVTLDDLTALVSGTTGSSDPLTVGNAYVDLLAGGFKNTNPEKAEEDNATIKDGFFKRLINVIVEVLVGSITAPPQIRVLMGMFNGFKNNNIPDIGNIIDDIKNQLNLINCLAADVKETINKFLFDLVKKELMELVIPVSKKILIEKINQYLGIIKSLIGFKL